MDATPRGRMLRALVVSVVAPAGALLAHRAGGGDWPAWLGLLAPWLLSLPVCTLLVGRRPNRTGLTLAVLAGQLLFHLMFGLGAPPAPGGVEGVALHAHHGPAASPTAPEVPGTGAPASEIAPMLLSHLVGALATVLVLLHGDALLRGLLAAGRRLRAALVPVVPRRAALVPREAPSHGDGAAVPAPSRFLLQRTPLCRRGPPAVPA